MNCTFADPVIIMNTTNFQRYKYECFSRDLDFGIATFSIMSAPGLLLSLIIFCRLEKDFKKSCLFILASPILCITYPIILFCVRVSGKWIENLTYYLSKHFTHFLINHIKMFNMVVLGYISIQLWWRMDKVYGLGYFLWSINGIILSTFVAVLHSIHPFQSSEKIKFILQ